MRKFKKIVAMALLIALNASTVLNNSIIYATNKVENEEIFFEDFEGAGVADRVGTGTKALKVTRVTDGSASKHFEFLTESGNQYLALKDLYPSKFDGVDHGRFNVDVRDTVNTNLTGRFSVETKFQIPRLVAGAKYYPITAYYQESDLAGGWNRGLTARFVYVVKEGDGFAFKVSNYVPEDTTVKTLGDSGTTIATAEAGKWYTLKLTFNIDGDAETVDTFSYDLTDGTNTYAGNGGAVGNKVAYSGLEGTGCPYNLTSLYMLAYGYIWDETSSGETSAETPDIIYLDDIVMKRVYATTYTSSIETGATNVDVNSNIVLTFSKAINDNNLDKIVVYEGNVEDNVVFQTTKTYNENDNTVTITPVSSFKYGRNYTVVVSSQITDVDGTSIDKGQIAFTTKTLPTDGVTIGAPTITNDVVAGETVTGNAVFTKNTYVSTHPLTFMAVAYDENGTKIGIAYTEEAFTADKTSVTLDFNFQIPETAVGTGSVKLMVWDSFANMKPVSDVWPAN